MSLFKRLLPQTEKISLIVGTVFIMYGLFLSNLVLRDDELNVNIFVSILFMSVFLIPLCFGFGLIGLGMNWNKKIVLTSFALCGFGIFCLLTLVLLLITGWINFLY